MFITKSNQLKPRSKELEFNFVLPQSRQQSNSCLVSHRLETSYIRAVGSSNKMLLLIIFLHCATSFCIGTLFQTNISLSYTATLSYVASLSYFCHIIISYCHNILYCHIILLLPYYYLILSHYLILPHSYYFMLPYHIILQHYLILHST